MTVTVSPKEIKVIKCNGVGACKKKKHNMYTIPPDYLSHIVVIGKWFPFDSTVLISLDLFSLIIFFAQHPHLQRNVQITRPLLLN